MMTDSILYNQEVTSEILNDIAIDLGNTSFNGFGTDKFGADELNDITASLVSKGVLLSDEQCKPILNGDVVVIQTGIIVFENGAKKKLTEAVEVPLIKNSYIYALNDVVSGTCQIIVSLNDPSTDEKVMLQDYITIAEINSIGEVWDAREYSTAKVLLPTYAVPITEMLNATVRGEGVYTENTERVLIKSYDFGKEINYIIHHDDSRVMPLPNTEETAELHIYDHPDDMTCEIIKNGRRIDFYTRRNLYSSKTITNFKLVFV